MEDCWKHDPSSRPAVDKIISRLNPDRVDNRLVGDWGRNTNAASHIRNSVRGLESPSLDDVEAIVWEFT
jgi:hypothetical protein